MDARIIKAVAIIAATLLAIVLVRGLMFLIGSQDPALTLTFVALASATFALEISGRLAHHFPGSEQETPRKVT